MPEPIRFPGYSANYVSYLSTALATRVIAGVTVPSSPLISAALSFARSHHEDCQFNHVVRCWLLGTIIADRTPGLVNRDRELHSIAAILHDIGCDRNEAFTASDKTFAVESGNAVRAFVERQASPGAWNQDRKQLLWDAVTMNATQKQPEVVATLLGIIADFRGPAGVPGNVLTVAEWQQIAREFPRVGLRNGIVQRMCVFCRKNPDRDFVLNPVDAN